MGYIHSYVDVRQKIDVSDIIVYQPTEPGLYVFRCAETEFEWEFAAITFADNKKLVHETGLGVTPLKTFHDGLIKIEWCRVA